MRVTWNSGLNFFWFRKNNWRELSCGPPNFAITTQGSYDLVGDLPPTSRQQHYFGSDIMQADLPNLASGKTHMWRVTRKKILTQWQNTLVMLSMILFGITTWSGIPIGFLKLWERIKKQNSRIQLKKIGRFLKIAL